MVRFTNQQEVSDGLEGAPETGGGSMDGLRGARHEVGTAVNRLIGPEMQRNSVHDADRDVQRTLAIPQRTLRVAPSTVQRTEEPVVRASASSSSPKTYNAALVGAAAGVTAVPLTLGTLATVQAGNLFGSSGALLVSASTAASALSSVTPLGVGLQSVLLFLRVIEQKGHWWVVH